jgi:hypothetical protein
VEADRAGQLERIVDARCPGSRQHVDDSATHLAEPIENRLGSGVPSAVVSVTGWDLDGPYKHGKSNFPGYLKGDKEC